MDVIVREFHYTYEITFADLTAMLQARERLSFRKTKAVAFWLLVSAQAAAVVLGLYILSLGDQSGWRIVGIGSIVLGSILALKFVGVPLVNRFYYRKMGMQGEPVEITFSEDGIRSSGKGMDSTIAWKGIEFATRSDKHFFPWVNSMQAVIFPTRCVSDEKQLEAIWALIERHTETRAL